MTSTNPDVAASAVPESWQGGDVGVLVIHGFTGSPNSMRPLARAYADAGFTVELPRLPGHGTSVEDLSGRSWDDWSSHVEQAYRELSGRVSQVAVVGLSMGGALAIWLAAEHPEIRALVTINALVAGQPVVVELVEALVEAGEETFDSVGNDIAKEGVDEGAYDRTPLRPLLSLGAALDELEGRLDSITAPTLVCCSPQDHVVPPAMSDLLAERVAGPVERVSLDRSYHVATLDHDAELIAERAVDFVSRHTAG